MATEIELANQEFEYQWRLAKVAAASGYYPDARKPEQTMAKIQLGHSLGLEPTQALIGLYIVEGKPMVAATTLASFVKRKGDHDFRVLHHDDQSCSIEFGPSPAPKRQINSETGEVEWIPWLEAYGTSTFTMEHANTADLVREKSGWVKYPRNMLYARAMSNGVKWYCPDATQGIPVYHEGEIEPVKIVDGIRSDEAEAAAPEQLSLTEIRQIFPESLRDRFMDVYADAAAHRANGLPSLASIRMVIQDMPDDYVVSWLDRQEAATARVKEEKAKKSSEDTITDAEVVEEGEVQEPVTEPSESGPEAVQADEETEPTVAPEDIPGVQKGTGGVATLRIRYDTLCEDRDAREAVGVDVPDDVYAEIAYLEGKLRESGVEIDGQGSLDV